MDCIINEKSEFNLIINSIKQKISNIFWKIWAICFRIYSIYFNNFFWKRRLSFD